VEGEVMKRPIVPIAIAVLLALLAGVLVFMYTSSVEDRAQEGQQSVSILVSTAVIPLGMTLGDANAGGIVTSSEITEKLKPAGSLSEVTSENAALVAQADIAPGQILMATSFGLAVPVSAPLAVPEGLMAVSIAMEGPGKVGSFLRPGSQVAVFGTVTATATDPGGQPVLSSRVLLDRVLVLAIGDITAASQSSATAESWQNTLVTLAVDQTQAEKLVQASRTGSLYMALLADTTTLKPSAGVSEQNLFDQGTAP
jgi:pilus assembly protein CpaB